MKKITMFYLRNCGYCHKADRALAALREENPEYAKLEIEKIEEQEHPEIADRYDYYATPTFYVGEDKAFEAHIGMSEADMREAVKKVLDQALMA